MESTFNRISIDDLLVSSTSRPRHSSKKPRPSPVVFKVECKYHGCDRKFLSHEHLRAHEKRQHARPTSFSCQHCYATFSTAPNRNKHVSYSKTLVWKFSNWWFLLSQFKTPWRPFHVTFSLFLAFSFPLIKPGLETPSSNLECLPRHLTKKWYSRFTLCRCEPFMKKGSLSNARLVN